MVLASIQLLSIPEIKKNVLPGFGQVKSGTRKVKVRLSVFHDQVILSTEIKSGHIIYSNRL
jgi:hypothetical protein